MQSPHHIPHVIVLAASLLAGCMATGSAPSSEELGASPPGTTPGDADASTTANGGADTGASPSDGGAGDAHTSDAANTHDADAPDAAGHAPDGSADGGPISTGTGHAVFRLAGRWRRIEARAGGAMQDLTSALDSLSSGADDDVNLAASGAWLALVTTRFGCQGYGCLALVDGDVGTGRLLTNAGAELHATGRAAVSADGTHVVFPAPGPHATDVYASARISPTEWSAPVLLTAASTFAYHHDIAISADGTKATFDCGADPYGAGGTALCEAHTDGTGFRKVLDPGSTTNALHHPGYTPGGSTAFEGAWTSEQIWRLPRGTTTPVQLAATQTNDNTPCVLPNGKVLSLFLSSPTNPRGMHELKVMSADGATFEMVLTGVDIEDIGLGCGE